MISKVFEKIRNGYKAINGTKGMVSIFLSLVMLPFLSTALLLTEGVRYQSAVELTDELLDMAGFSTLNNYDSYLEERFGFLAMTQKATPSDNFSKYYTANENVLQNGFAKTSLSVSGLYPLSTKSVFREQLMDYGELTAMLEAVYNGLSIDELLKSLYEKLGVSELNKYAEATSAVGDTASAAADLVDAIKEAVKAHDKYKAQLDKYNKAQKDFVSDAGSLIDDLDAAYSNLEEDEGDSDAYDDSDVKNSIKNLEKSYKAFKDETKKMSSEVGEMRKAVTKLFSTADSVSAKAQKAQEKMDKLDGSSAASATKTAGDWILRVTRELTNVVNKTAGTSYSNEMQDEIDALDAQREALDKVIFDKSAATYKNDGKYRINVNISKTKVEKDFARVQIDTVKSNFSETLNRLIGDLDKKSSSIDEDQSTGLLELFDLCSSLLGISLFYDGQFDANVANSNFYTAKPTEQRYLDANTTITSSINTVVQAGEDFVESLTELNIFKALKAAGEFLLGIAKFLVAIVEWAGNIIVNVYKLVASGTEIYDAFIIASYSTYNLPCRTTALDGKSLSGYSYSKIFDMMGGRRGGAVSGALSDLKMLSEANGSGSDAGFRGAETEYVLVGGSNELANQATSFFNIFMFRLVLDLYAVFTDQFAQQEAAAATIASWAVYLILIICEPLLDTIILVSGDKMFLFKERCFLTPVGVTYLIGRIPNIVKLSKSTSDVISEKIKNHWGNIGKSEDNHGILKMDYQSHMLLLLLLSTDQDTMLQRIQNIVYMEAKEKYRLDYTFDLTKTYTCLKVNAKGKLDPLFDLEKLTNGSAFTTQRTRYLSY